MAKYTRVRRSEAAKKGWSDSAKRKKQSEILKIVLNSERVALKRKRISSRPDIHEIRSETAKKTYWTPSIYDKRIASYKKTCTTSAYKKKKRRFIQEMWSRPEYRNKIRHSNTIPILQIDKKSGQIIREFQTEEEAVEYLKYNNFKGFSRLIKDIKNNKVNSHWPFTFKFKYNTPNHKPPKNDP